MINLNFANVIPNNSSMIQWPFCCLSKLLHCPKTYEMTTQLNHFTSTFIGYHLFVSVLKLEMQAFSFLFFFFAFWAKLIDHHKMRLACEIFLKQSKLTGPPNLHSFPEVKRISIKWIDSIPSRTLFNKNYIWKSRGKLCTLKKLKELWPYWPLRNR